ncbi:MAG: inner membrane protein YccS, partial [Actinomycetota bacterium]
AAGDANASAVRAALGPRGKSVPRQVVIDVGPMHDAAEKAAAAGDKAAAGTWRLWASSQQQAAAALGGQVVPRLLLRPALMIVLALLRSLLHPDVSAFRYGIQRALGLGLAIFALVLSHGNEGVFWIAVTLMTVLQQNMPQTLVKTLQRVIGTFLGVAVALACAAVLPSWVLVPWLAGIAILIALAFQSRNYALMSGLIAFSIVLLMGAPSDKVAEFAGMRALNVFIGGVIAALIARVVFPVHADPARRRQQVITALQNLLGAIRDRLADPKSLSVEAVIGKQAVAVTKLSNLRNAIDDERDRQVAEAYRKDLAGLTACNEELFVIGTVVVRLVENPVKGDLSVDDALTEIGDQINNLAKDAPVAVSSPTASGT